MKYKLKLQSKAALRLRAAPVYGSVLSSIEQAKSAEISAVNAAASAEAATSAAAAAAISKSGADTSAADAAASAAAASTAATTATTKAGEASTSATNAAASATTATTKAGEAAASATSAAGSATTATTKAGEAATSATAAAGSATTATTKAGEAATSATAAAGSATTATTKAGEAATSASAAAGSATTATTKAGEAATSASAAATSATAAAASATAAAGSASAAAASAASVPQLRSGNGAPSSGLGSDGDFYIDDAAKLLYGPKAGGAWPAGVSVIGPQGLQGLQGLTGADGKTVRYGSGAPSSGLGVDGDFYIDTTAKALYGPKASGSWPAGTSLIGPTGPAGPAGAGSGDVLGPATHASAYVPTWNGANTKTLSAGYPIDVSGTALPLLSGANVWGAQQAFPLGSASAPGIAIAGDLNTGVYSPGADQLGLVAGSVAVIRIDGNGRVAIGTTPSINYMLVSNRPITGATTVYGISETTTILSDVTSTVDGFRTSLATAAADFTLQDLRHFSANQSTFGAGSKVSAQYGFYVSNNLAGAANNYGIYSGIPAGATRTISSVERTSNVVTIGTTAAHGYTVGQLVRTAATANTGVNGDAVITAVPTTSSYSYASVGTDIAATSDTGSAVVIGRWNIYVPGGAPNYFAGNICIGAPETYAIGGLPSPRVEINGNNGQSSSMAFARWTNDTGSGAFAFAKSRGAIGTHTIVANGDALGAIYMYGSDGTQFALAGYISGHADGVPTSGSNSVPGRLVFTTTSPGSTSPTERLRIDSAGVHTITGSIQNSLGSASLPSYAFAGDSDTGPFSPGTNAWAVSTAGVERFRLDAGGRMALGSAGNAAYSFYHGKQSTGNATLYAMGVLGEIQSDVTTGYGSFRSIPGIVAANFTLPFLRHYVAEQGTFGAGAKVTEQIGYLAQSTLTSAANNYGFYGNIGISTTRTITNVSRTGNVATATTSAAHGIPVGVTTRVAVTTNTSLNGDVVVTDVPTSTTFSFASVGPDIASTADTGSATVVGRWNAYMVGLAPNHFAGQMLVGSGLTTPLTTPVGAGQLQTLTSQSVVRFSTNFSAELEIGRSKTATVGGHAALANGDRMGALTFIASDGTSFLRAAQISAEVDGTPGTNDMPGRLVFATTADGAFLPTERLRIDSSGLHTITGSIANSLGSTSLPTYSFAGDLNSGVWSPGADTLAASVGGLEAWRVSPDRTFTITGSQRIGSDDTATLVPINSYGGSTVSGFAVNTQTYTATDPSGPVTAASSSSNAIGTGTKTFTVPAGMASYWGAGARVVIVTSSSASSWMLGTIVSYSGTTLTVDVTSSSGSGTYTTWTIKLSKALYAAQIINKSKGFTNPDYAACTFGLDVVSVKADRTVDGQIGALHVYAEGGSNLNTPPRNFHSGADQFGANDIGAIQGQVSMYNDLTCSASQYEMFTNLITGGTWPPTIRQKVSLGMTKYDGIGDFFGSKCIGISLQAFNGNPIGTAIYIGNSGGTWGLALGTSAGAYMDMNGNIHTVSDPRAKSELEVLPAPSLLSVVRDVDPCSWRYLDSPDRTSWGVSSRTHGAVRGLAEALEEAGIDPAGVVTPGERQRVSQTALTAILWGALQELSRRVDHLTKH